VSLQVGFVGFISKIPLATNITNSNELTPHEFVLVCTSSLLFSFSCMIQKFIADFAVKKIMHRKERKVFSICVK